MRKKLMFFLSLLLVTATVLSGPTASQLSVQAETTEAETTTVDMSKLLDMSELYGWATVKGEGIVTTTGGGSAEPQIVTTIDELTELAGDDVPRVIVVSGRIECGGYGVLVGNNKTIVGIDSDATVYGGFRIHNSNNIIISNLNIEGTWPNSGPDDCLEIKTSHHIWLNHLNIWNSTDGNVDITLGSDYLTVSWCKMWYTPDAKDGADPEHPHRLSCLVGSGAGEHEDTDMDRLRVTFHHNWFADLLDQRMPRVMFGRCHVYNNYYSCEGNTYGVGVDSYASVLIENNYFKKVKNPHEFSYDPGFPACITARGNIYDETTGNQTVGQHYENSTVKPFETTVYDYYLNDAADIPEIVQAYVGPQDMSDETVVPDKLKNGAIVEGVEEEDEDVMPDVTPLPTQTPTNLLNDNPISYDEESNTYIYHGQNSDGSHAYCVIENPFKGYDFSETPTYPEGYPVWTKGATISYWVNVPVNAVDAAVLNFNLENERQMERNDQVKYNICKNYSEDDASYSMSEIKTFVDEAGNEYPVIEWYGMYVHYNPNYPTDGCYTISTEGGSVRAYEKGTDPADENNWWYLNYNGAGLYESYSRRFDEEGGSKSKIREALVSGSLSIYASGSVGYRQDNWHGLQMNPYLRSYGQILDVQQYNQHYYWGNGGYMSLEGYDNTPTMEEKGEWHFVVVVIQNDWVQFYMDGIKMDFDYLSWWDKPIEMHAGSKGFNLGYGHRWIPRTKNPSAADRLGMTILEMLSDEDTVLTVGGLGAGATRLGQERAGSPAGVKVKDLQFYYVPVEEDCIKEDKIVLNPSLIEIYDQGDINNDKTVNLDDANAALKAALGIGEELSESAKIAADVNEDGDVTLDDANLILQMALGIIKGYVPG